jgi:cytochrome oxidase Cu insertion factor (SCO1/SenC/PrrC family)
LALAASAAALALALVALITGASSGPAPSRTRTTSFAGAPLPNPALAPGFTLADQSGRPVSLAGQRGRVTVLAFLSTSCAPACVLIAQQIRGALDELAHAPQVLIVSADPAADTPPRMARFLEQVGLTNRVHYLTGSAGVLESVWRAYGVRPLRSGRAAFERAAEVRLIDGRGRERVLFGIEQLTPEGLAHDLRMLGVR